MHITQPIHVQPIPFVDPVDAFEAFADDPVAALLDSADAVGGRGRYAFLAGDPYHVIEAAAGDDPFGRLSRELARARTESVPGLPPFQTGAVGVLGYELGAALERLPDRKAGGLAFPDMVMGFYDTVAVFDMKLMKAWVLASNAARASGRRRPGPEARARAMAARIAAAGPRPEPAALDLTWRADQTRPEMEARIARAIDYIRLGDIFQANIAQRFLADLPADTRPFDVYRRLRRISSAPFAAFLNCGEGRAVISASPERFLSLGPGGAIETRPIKGTRPRGVTTDEDRALAAALIASEKDRAENLMIVDLLRNDLSRVARIGSVKVSKLFELETFARVHHLVSEVKADIAEGLDAVDLLRATFPGGSITGAPKIRAMEIIHELEPVPRGPYCGAVAWMGFDGAMDSSIAIRTMTYADGVVAAQAGGGIVADSDPADEYEETMTKIRPLLAALDARVALP
ncbi:MAG: aminodeoxychorismate synthase, component I [Rhodospirillales bacterium CG15_BIG_FIL_POST_REV_8_21_14_020_66_15]|nr:MAG: aminodeoxychorismate synthase, component I [Rhodospirillales bacterium CG15_BIG_FIL_POST_REV_8_21_14_020_66_15]